MSDWITDRRPTEEDAISRRVIWWSDYCKECQLVYFDEVALGEPWKPLPKCEPYVKPKRWTAVWYGAFGGWALRDNVKGAYIPLFDDSLPFGLVNNDDEHREAAEEIAAIYERTMS